MLPSTSSLCLSKFLTDSFTSSQTLLSKIALSFRIVIHVEIGLIKNFCNFSSFSTYFSYSSLSLRRSSFFNQYFLAFSSAILSSNCSLFSNKYVWTLILCLKKNWSSFSVFLLLVIHLSIFSLNDHDMLATIVHEGNLERNESTNVFKKSFQRFFT